MAAAAARPPRRDDARASARGAVGEIRYAEDERQVALLAVGGVPPELLDGREPAGLPDAAAIDVVGRDRFMWGSDYPHDEGTYPHTREATCGPASTRWRRPSLHQILAVNAAALYDFDLDALAPLAAEHGPTVAEIADAAHRAAAQNPSQGLARGLDVEAHRMSDDMDAAAL